MGAEDHPEPVEPTMFATEDGIYCLAHGVMDCTEPFCWRCNNHEMDDFGRCADPRCRATCTPEAMAVVARVKATWRRPVPLEVLTLEIGENLRRWMPRDNSTPSLPGEPGGGGVPEPSVPATGAPDNNRYNQKQNPA